MVSQIFERIRNLIKRGEIWVSSHGYDELVQDNILAREVLEGIQGAIVVEDYPDYAKEPCSPSFYKKTTRGTPSTWFGVFPAGNRRPRFW